MYFINLVPVTKWLFKKIQGLIPIMKRKKQSYNDVPPAV